MRVQMDAYTEEDLVRGLHVGSAEMVRFIYRKNMSTVKYMVMKFPHIGLEPEDVIQEGLTRLILNIREGKFSGKSSVHTYLYSICRNICLKEAERIGKEKKVASDENYSRNPLGDLNEQNEEDGYFDQIKMVMDAKNQMDKKCIEIIDARFGLHEKRNAGPRTRDTERETLFTGHETRNRLIPFEELAERLGISPDNARQRFKRCLDKLIRVVRPI